MSDLEALASFLGNDSSLLDLDDDAGAFSDLLAAAPVSAPPAQGGAAGGGGGSASDGGSGGGGGGGGGGVKRARTDSFGEGNEDDRRARRLALNRASARTRFVSSVSDVPRGRARAHPSCQRSCPRGVPVPPSACEWQHTCRFLCVCTSVPALSWGQYGQAMSLLVTAK